MNANVRQAVRRGTNGVPLPFKGRLALDRFPARGCILKPNYRKKMRRAMKSLSVLKASFRAATFVAVALSFASMAMSVVTPAEAAGPSTLCGTSKPASGPSKNCARAPVSPK